MEQVDKNSVFLVGFSLLIAVISSVRQKLLGLFNTSVRAAAAAPGLRSLFEACRPESETESHVLKNSLR